MNEHVTLMHPDARDPTARAISSGFPVDLLSQSAGRLRVLALLYAFVFFMAGIFPSLLFPSERARFLGHRGAVRAAAFTRDGRSVASGGEDNQIQRPHRLDLAPGLPAAAGRVS